MSDDRCTCPPFIDGGVLRRQSCRHHKTPTPAHPAPLPTRDPDLDELACAWADYRKDYGASGAQQHKAFAAGWKAARSGDQAGVFR